MLRKLTVAAGLALTVLIAAPASASDAQLGYVSAPFGTSNGAVLFYTDGTRGTPPSCSSPGLEQRFAIDASTLVGQAQLSVFLTAYAQHKRIFIVGRGTCDIWGDTETVNWFAVE